MSQIPKDTQSKYNKDNKFGWVDSQLEKFMTEQKELKDEISELEKENKKQKEKYNRLYKLYTEGTPTDGLEVGSPEDYK
jgi:predicted RNase H-like nuclease (RuvC/YqgF family)